MATLSDLYSNQSEFSPSSSSDRGATTVLPLSLHRNLQHQSPDSLTVRIPQDVESHASSVLGVSGAGIDNDGAFHPPPAQIEST